MIKPRDEDFFAMPMLLLDIITSVCGITTRKKVRACIVGQMVVDMRDCGSIITFMGMAF